MKKTETDRFLPHRPTHRSSPRKAPFPTEEKVVAHRGTNPPLTTPWKAIVYFGELHANIFTD